MSSKLDWGLAISESISRKSWLANDGGYRLFCMSGSKITFPEHDYTVWWWTKLSAIGWINTNPIRLEVKGSYFLTASDEHKFYWSITLTIRLKSSPRAWEIVVMSRDSLQVLLESIIEEVGRDTFRDFTYSSISDASVDVVNAITTKLKQRIAAESPYELLGCRFEVAADDPALDDAMALTRRTMALARERERTEGIEREDERRRREAELSANQHRSFVARDLAEARRAEEAEDQAHRLHLLVNKAVVTRTINRAEADLAHEVLARLTELFGGNATLATLSKFPELLAKIALGEIELKANTGKLMYKTGVADGSIRAINAILRGQDLSDNEQVVRINIEGGNPHHDGNDDEQ